MEQKLYYGGTILTMDPTAPRAEAVLTCNGRICRVGPLSGLRDAEAEAVDLRGRTLMPGFVDGHSHMITVGENLTRYCSLEGCESFAQLLERIRSFVRRKDLRHGENIVCRGYDLAVLKEGRHPTAALLDSLGLDNPIACIHVSGHVAVYNTPAMKKAGIREDTYVCPEGGFAGRDEQGRLNGYFEETAKRPFTEIFNSKTTDEQLEEAILAAQEYYIRHGFTTVQEGSANTAQRLRVLQKLAEAGKLKVDVVAYMSAGEDAPALWEEALARSGRGYRGRLKLGGVKLFLDGSPQVRTAWMRQPYEGETEYRGYPTLTDAQVEQRIENAVRWGLQPIAHCNGDAACEQFIRAWEKLGKPGMRPVMIHAQTVGYDQLARMARAGMMASFFVGHCFYWGDTHLKNFGQRGMRISPVGQAMRCGVPFSFHQDSPITRPDMLHSVWCAVNRMTRDGVLLGREDCVDCGRALAAATNGGAYTYFEENEKGILKPGAAADFVILDRDPTEVAPMEIKDIRVLATIKADQILFEELP